MHDRGCGPQQHRGPKNLADLVGAVGRAPTVPEMEQDDETVLGAAPPRRESFAKSRASPLGARAAAAGERPRWKLPALRSACPVPGSGW